MSVAPTSPPSTAPAAATPSAPGDAVAARRHRLTLLFICACAILIGLSRPLWDADESRYAEIPREMGVHQTWLSPTLDGLIYLEKPPLQYWATLLVYQVGGVHAPLARLVPGLYFLGTVLLMYAFLRRYVGAEIAYFTAGMLLFQPLFLFLGLYLITDGPLTFWLTLALTSLGRMRMDATPRARDALLFWLGALGAFFTKALIGLAFPLVILGLDVLLRRDVGRLRKVWLPWLLGALVTVGLCGWWLQAMQAVHPDFYHYFFIEQHLNRFLGAQHESNWFFGLFAWLVFSWPWWPLLWPTVKAAGRALFPRPELPPPAPTDAPPPPAPANPFAEAPPAWRPLQGFLFIWAVTIYGVFAISRGQLLTYFLPAIPPLLTLLAIQFHLAPPQKQHACVRLGWLSGWIAVAGGLALILSTGANYSLNLEMATGPLHSLVTGVGLLIATVLFYLILGHRFLPRKSGRDPLMPYVLLMLVGLYSLQVIGENQSCVSVAADPLATKLAAEHPDFQLVHWSDHTGDADRAAGLYFGFQREIIHVGSSLFPVGKQKPAELVDCKLHSDPQTTARLLYPDWSAYLAANRPIGTAVRHVLLLCPRDRERDLPKNLSAATVEEPVIHGRYLLFHLALSSATPDP